MARIARTTISNYAPTYDMRHATHYLVCDRHNVISTNTGGSKRDAFQDAAIMSTCDPRNAPYNVWRYTAGSGELRKLDN